MVLKAGISQLYPGPVSRLHFMLCPAWFSEKVELTIDRLNGLNRLQPSGCFIREILRKRVVHVG